MRKITKKTKPSNSWNRSKSVESNKKDFLDYFSQIISTLATVVAAILIPLIILSASNKIQTTIADQSLDKDYVQLAINILTAPSESVDPALRSWAVDLLKYNSKQVPLDPTAIAELKSGKIVLPVIPNSPSPTPGILFQDNFLLNNKNWQLPDSSGGAKVDASIVGGKLNISIICPQNYNINYCNPYFRVPNLALKNFNLTFEVLYKQLSVNTNAIIGIVFRYNGSGNYYLAQYNVNGDWLLSLYQNGNNLSLGTGHMGQIFNTNQIYSYGLDVNGSNFIMSVDGKIISTLEDGNINIPAPIDIYIYVLKGGSASLEVDSILITPP